MTSFAAAAAFGQSQAEATMGQAFAFPGARYPGVFTGVIDAHRRRVRLEMGGLEIDADATLSASKPQFSALPPLAPNVRLTIDRREYVVVEVQEDDAAYTFILKSAE